MKQIQNTLAFLILFISVGLSTSCSKDDAGPVAPGITTAQVNTAITSGTWRITFYNEAGTEKTEDFSGYGFVFNADGTLIASNSAVTKNGTWNSTADSGSIKIPISFETETEGPFESISEDWIVTTSTAAKLELKHVSGGDGSTDLLTFQKN